MVTVNVTHSDKGKRQVYVLIDANEISDDVLQKVTRNTYFLANSIADKLKRSGLLSVGGTKGITV